MDRHALWCAEIDDLPVCFKSSKNMDDQEMIMKALYRKMKALNIIVEMVCDWLKTLKITGCTMNVDSFTKE